MQWATLPFFEDKEHGDHQKKEPDQVIPGQLVRLKDKDGDERKHG